MHQWGEQEQGNGVQFTKSERIGFSSLDHFDQVPFSLWTILHRNWGWVTDTTLRWKSGKISFCKSFFSRVECFDKVRSEQCCQSVRLRWQSSVKTLLVAYITKRMLSRSWVQIYTNVVQVRWFDWRFPFFIVGRLHHGRLQQRGQYNTQQQVFK